MADLDYPNRYRIVFTVTVEAEGPDEYEAIKRATMACGWPGNYLSRDSLDIAERHEANQHHVGRIRADVIRSQALMAKQVAPLNDLVICETCTWRVATTTTEAYKNGPEIDTCGHCIDAPDARRDARICPSPALPDTETGDSTPEPEIGVLRRDRTWMTKDEQGADE